MSELLDEIIEARKAKAIEYEEYLRQISELAQRVEMGVEDDTPEQVIKGALFEVLQDESEVERIFLVIKARSEY